MASFQQFNKKWSPVSFISLRLEIQLEGHGFLKRGRQLKHIFRKYFVSQEIEAYEFPSALYQQTPELVFLKTRFLGWYNNFFNF